MSKINLLRTEIIDKIKNGTVFATKYEIITICFRDKIFNFAAEKDSEIYSILENINEYAKKINFLVAENQRIKNENILLNLKLQKYSMDCSMCGHPVFFDGINSDKVKKVLCSDCCKPTKLSNAYERFRARLFRGKR